MLRKKLLLFPFILLLGWGNFSCGGGGFANPLFMVLFVSNRLSPGNAEGDGDIFLTNILEAGSIVNATEAGSEPGDDNDYACAVDLTDGRNRLFFVSERTDIDNVGGDIDIFMVPLSGGAIVNLTDGDPKIPGDADDLCLGVLPNSGNLVFESTRTDQGSADGDLDIYVAALTFNVGGAIIGATISNRTEESDANPVDDHLVWIGQGGTLYFESTRTAPDDSADTFTNTDNDQHIFSVPSSGAATIRNLTHDGNQIDATEGNPSFDVFCGISENESTIAFHSTRNQGADGTLTEEGPQISDQTAATAQDIFVRNLNQDQELMGPVNSAIANLTDAGVFTNGVTPGDGKDACNFGFGGNAITNATGQDLVLFASGRTSAGTHRTDGDGTGFSTFSEVSNFPMDPIDIFSSTVVFTPTAGVLNEVTNLSDGASANDDVDTKVGICGTNVIFASARTDLAPGGGGPEDDLYSANLISGQITNLTDGNAGDATDVFFCCNETNSRISFFSERTDVGNANMDVDIFTAPISNPAGLITNLSDDATGDGDDAFSDITMTASAANGGTGLPSGAFAEGQGTPLTSGLDPVGSYTDFPFACNTENYMVWLSDRTQPRNSSPIDIDVFTVKFEEGDGSLTTNEDFINLSDNSNAANDANDGLTAVGGFAVPDSFF